MNRKLKKVCTTLNYIKHFLILVSVVTRCILYASLLGIPIGLTSSVIGLKTCAITAGIQLKMKKHYKIVLLAKSKLNSIEVLISKVLVDSSISYDQFVLIDNALKEYGYMKEEIKNLKTETVHRSRRF